MICFPRLKNLGVFLSTKDPLYPEVMPNSQTTVYYKILCLKFTVRPCSFSMPQLTAGNTHPHTTAIRGTALALCPQGHLGSLQNRTTGSVPVLLSCTRRVR